jgi:RNA polymerase sigma factor (sigma-70 family)
VAIMTADEMPSGERSSEETLIERERDQRFHLALEALTDRQRQCLHLRGEGLRYREIAAVLSISIDSVADALERAIHKVRKGVHE